MPDLPVPNNSGDNLTTVFRHIEAYLYELAQNGGGGGGGVSSVGLSLPSSVFDVTGSPVTGAGTLTGSFKTQAANQVLAGPTGGGAAAPTFRALVAADMVAAGSNTQVQFNDNGVLGADAGFLYEDGVARLGQDGSQAGQLVLFDSGGSAGSIVIHDNAGGLFELRPSATDIRTVTTPDASGTMVLDSTEKIRQVVIVAPKTDTASGTNTAAAWATVYSGSITTTLADSKVIVFCCSQFGLTTSFQGFCRLQRNGTPLVQADAAGSRVQTFAGFRTDAQARTLVEVTLIASDTPGSAASHTYDLAAAVESGGTWYLNRSADDADASHIARGASTMFLIEVAP